jgi:RNA-directed DNA polymerase
MSREIHVRFCEGLGVRFPRATQLVVLARYQGQRLIRWIEGMLEGRFKLVINRRKTKTIDLDQPGASLDFLGFTFRYDRCLRGRPGRYLNVFPSCKALARARERVRVLTGSQRCFVPIPELIGQINRWQRGWAAYFRHGYPALAFRQVNWFVYDRFVRHLKRRSQRPFRPPKGVAHYRHLQALGWQPVRTQRTWLLVHAL